MAVANCLTDWPSNYAATWPV